MCGTVIGMFNDRQHCDISVIQGIRGDFEVFRPAWATRCTDGGEIWHGGVDRSTPRQISPPSVQGWSMGPKIENFTKISAFKYPARVHHFGNFTKVSPFVGSFMNE